MNNEAEQILPPNSNNQRPAVETFNLTIVTDYSTVCRVCATVTEMVIPIFGGEGLKKNLADKINQHLPITVSPGDTLPLVVCCECTGTLLAAHELAECCRQADRALRTREAKRARCIKEKIEAKRAEARQEKEKAEENAPKSEWSQAWNEVGSDDYWRNGDDQADARAVASSSEDDDRPLAKLASEKAGDPYGHFYTALLNFRNHFLTEHEAKSSYPEFTESSEAEPAAGSDADDYDDLTGNNMRKDRMDEATRLELAQVLTRIDGKPYYTCRVCGKNLSSPHTYVFHARIHTGERPCVCHVCGKQFRAPHGLRRHLAETHERRRRLACRTCARTFANSQNLKQHLRTHTGERPYSCAACGKRFAQSGSLHAHRKTHSAALPHRCAHCGAAFRLRAGLARHRLRHSGERPHACALCSRAFRTRGELAAHADAHAHAHPAVRAHACAACHATFRSRRALRHHARRLHEPPPPPPQHQHQPPAPAPAHPAARGSPRAGESLLLRTGSALNGVGDPPQVSNIESQSRIETETSSAVPAASAGARSRKPRRRRPCPACGLWFSDAGNLARHARTAHAAARPHACARCPATFARRDHLRDHERTHSAAREFVCDACGAASRSAAALRMHRRSHQPRRHPCLHCGKRFRRRAELVAHVSVHTGERAHACSCGAAFRLRAQLTRHRRTHRAPAARSARADRACSYCGAVVDGAQYEAHLQRQHARLLFHCDECDNFVARRLFQQHMDAHGAEYEVLLGRSLRRRAELCKAPAYDDTTTAPADSTTARHEEPAPVVDTAEEPVGDDFSDLSDGEPFEPLPEAVLNAMEDSQDPPARAHPPAEAPNPAAPVEFAAPVPLAIPGDRVDSDAALIPELPDADTTAAAPAADASQIVNADPGTPVAPARADGSRRVRQCPHCPKSYTASSSYFYHLKYFHGGSKEHPCATCGRRFGTRGALREHAALHEPARPLACAACGKTFRSKAGLYIHAETHSSSKKYGCATCGRSFRWSAALRRHAARHSARRAHACASCDKAFSVRADLLRHAHTHTRARHACPRAGCGATFAQPRYLRAHLRRKHDDRHEPHEPPA